ncbi:nitrate regulatory gene2 protein isoform X2 [Abrus precatorius]|uniref:Nitrate regulatory gene2 protein isoform X2 n=1 Tax=Abrus precatorius TaxID=3816 RepID=A0A8B8K4K4_ABRPR|nr:nitrate regulatory gene2 protein isoform X2 [Abrus precatorius]
MGCGGSKVEDFPAVALCRERKGFLKAASNQRYALAAAHVAYFHSLREIGDALRNFVDQDLLLPAGSSSPVLTLPSDEGKPKTKNNKLSSSSPSISHPDSPSPQGSHLHLSSGSEFSSPSPSPSPSSHHLHIHHSPDPDPALHPDPSPSSFSHPPYGYYENYQYAHYMKSSAPRGKSMVYQEPERHVATTGQWFQDPSSYGYGNGGFYGFPGGDYNYYPPSGPGPGPSTPSPPPAPPSPPRVSTWDFLNFFESLDNGYPGYLNGFGSRASSPDSKEVREREGIPELEDETEHEIVKEVPSKEKKKVGEEKGFGKGRDFGEGPSNSKAVPLQQVSSSEGSSKTVRFHDSDENSQIKSSPETVVSDGSPETKKRVSFEAEVDEATVTTVDGESSILSSVTTLSAHGTRDLREVVQEIRDEFVTASDYGKEVALLLEVCKPPYRPRVAAFRVIFSRILQMVAPSRLPLHPLSGPPIQFSSREMKLAQAYCGEPGKDNPENLSSTLEKLYAWEKKLYKEVKDEERLRAVYEKQYKRLKTLDNQGAESSKIDSTRASIRKLQTKINICIRTAETIMGRIHKLRDNELQPQLAALINGFIRMWKFMLKCHQKQFQAIMESKSQSLRINIGLQRDDGLKAILDLEKELLNWCNQFNNWVKTQKSYVENLNEWLIRCLPNEPEETADGIVPFSPSRIEAPPVFIICNDWHQAMTRISERGVAAAMHEFALKLHELWERQDEEQRQRIKAEYLTKDFEKQLKTLHTQMGGTEHEHDKVSGKTALSKLASDSGVSPLDDLKVDLDSMKKRLHEERTRHKEAIKLVRDAASNSLQAGLIPIFKTLESFTSEVVKAHEQVRLQNAEDS